MFSRGRVKDRGDSELPEGGIIEKTTLLETNAKLRKDGKKAVVALQLLLGISKVASITESFLSAASFQDTARVLVRAAIENRVDVLRGLKENVIIGRLIPSSDPKAATVEPEEEVVDNIEESSVPSEASRELDESQKLS